MKSLVVTVSEVLKRLLHAGNWHLDKLHVWKSSSELSESMLSVTCINTLVFALIGQLKDMV